MTARKVAAALLIGFAGVVLMIGPVALHEGQTNLLAPSRLPGGGAVLRLCRRLRPPLPQAGPRAAADRVRPGRGSEC